MVKIRLRRVGAKNRPFYRIVVADSRAPRDGAFIEVVGHYSPLDDPETFTVDKEKVEKWLGNGAKPTETVARLLSKAGIIEKPQDTSKTTRRKKPGKSKSSTQTLSTAKE
jgi:small subunit ribosomal protein S16